MYTLGLLSAVAAALTWGSGDFSGGLASRKGHPFQVLLWSSLSGALVLVVCAFLWGETLPQPGSVLWAAFAGVLGALGLAALYGGLSLGSAASVAPTAAVIGAVLPVFFTLLTQGLPKTSQMAGFILALPGIALVTRSPGSQRLIARRGFLLGCLAGVMFGGFFISIAQIEPGKVFIPLTIARLTSALTALGLLLKGGLRVPAPGSNRVALLAGLLDAGGNVFFLLAETFTRLDAATVISSFYPAATLILAYALLKERVSASQWLGAALCLASMGLISV